MFLQKKGIQIKIAENEQELTDLYQFRYRIYIQELSRDQKHADHKKRLLKEPLDVLGINLIAKNEDQIIGSARVNLSKLETLGNYVELYDIKKVDQHLGHTAIVTKFMVSQEYRRSVLSLLLANECFQIGKRNHVKYTFIDCYPKLINYFKKLGFRSYRDNIHHPEYGDVIPLVLYNEDIDHLKRVNSPFLKLHNKLLITKL